MVATTDTRRYGLRRAAIVKGTCTDQSRSKASTSLLETPATLSIQEHQGLHEQQE
jgi:hypothetical protein